MADILLTILLAFVWIAITGAPTYLNIILGLAISLMVVIWARRFLGRRGTGSRAFRLVFFLLFFIKEILISSIEVAVRVIPFSPFKIRPAIVAVPLDLETDAGITTLANMITLTPGTLALETSMDRKTLYVHVMYVEDIPAFIDDIKTRYERRVKELVE